jgi:hypothetical protein
MKFKEFKMCVVHTSVIKEKSNISNDYNWGCLGDFGTDDRYMLILIILFRWEIHK